MLPGSQTRQEAHQADLFPFSFGMNWNAILKDVKGDIKSIHAQQDDWGVAQSMS